MVCKSVQHIGLLRELNNHDEIEKVPVGFLERVLIYRCPEVQDNCTTYLLDLYLSKLPIQAFTDDTFYMQPLAAFPLAALLL